MTQRAEREMDAQLEVRRSRRLSASRFAGNLLLWDEALTWFKKNLPGNVRHGRIHGELIVSAEAFDYLPGDEVKAFTNPLGEAVYRKKVSILGSPTLELVVTTIVSEVDEA